MHTEIHKYGLDIDRFDGVFIPKTPRISSEKREHSAKEIQENGEVREPKHSIVYS